MERLVNKTAIITGAARGIGRAIAEAFVSEGADVAVADLAPENAVGELLGTLRSGGRRALYVRTDVSQEADVRAMVERVVGELGRVDILVNDAGIFSQVFLHEMTAEQWDKVISVNLRSVFLCTRYVLPQMLERGSGKIINVGSQLGQIGGQEMVHYSASKGGVIAFTKALAREVSAKGVHVNAIAPGPILTDMMAEETDEWKDKKLSELPIGRFGQAYEVAPTAVFLASDDSSYYVGQTLGPNGGDVML
ncbi:MAG: 3-oxoacyl-ACP reductase FabG [Candidatus Dormibacteraeota bacterium]|uniref:3-oxoacyl-ACP reductase FabG n=1 Tax=Candidatus Dormiibacter inghamiae TaxID=3127013 RepID=A0A934KGY7_9BACT|nr:3-oxoacyl-ACP reductase FabG [Candidatus Dormibacteraeota bacterium]MBJ7606503.1 3-oxoacyl-ACP reductase FabG [Candidatus Dormibacteraeota bacterium]